jgi:hypothetical protein
MLKDPYVVENGRYCDKKGVVFYGTKTVGPRGDYYDVIVLIDDGKVLFGDEQGNYAGGIYIVENWKNHLAYVLHHDLGLREVLVDYLKKTDEWVEVKQYLKDMELYY